MTHDLDHSKQWSPWLWLLIGFSDLGVGLETIPPAGVGAEISESAPQGTFLELIQHFASHVSCSVPQFLSLRGEDPSFSLHIGVRNADRSSVTFLCTY